MKLVLLPGMDGTGLLFEPLVAVLLPTLEPVVVRYPPDEPLDTLELMAPHRSGAAERTVRAAG